MLGFKKKIIIISLIYASFFIVIPVIKNETRLIEKNIQNYKSKILLLEKNLSEAHLEFQYLTSPEVLQNKVSKNIDIDYDNLNIFHIYLHLDDFINKQKQITKVIINEK